MVTPILKQPGIAMGIPPNDLGTWGQGSPEGNHNAAPGQLYFDQLNGVLYVKQRAYGNTGWIPVFSSGSSQISGSGSPEGSVSALPGAFYWDSVNKVLYVKDTASGTTGWRNIIA